jgi:hypothetical protein
MEGVYIFLATYTDGVMLYQTHIYGNRGTKPGLDDTRLVQHLQQQLLGFLGTTLSCRGPEN